MNCYKIIGLIVVLAVSSCAPVYIPNSPFVFNNDQKGDYTVNYRQGAFSSNLQGGYAITDNLNAGLSLSALYSPTTTVGTFEYSGTEAVEIGAVFGYYNKFTSNTTFELNGGFGPLFYSQPQGLQNYVKAFIQPSFTFSSRGDTRTDVTLLARGVGTSFTYVNATSDTLVNNFFIEPVISLSVGNQIRFNTQLGLSIPSSQTYFVDNVSSPFIFNVGIGYTIPRNSRSATLP